MNSSQAWPGLHDKHGYSTYSLLQGAKLGRKNSLNRDGRMCGDWIGVKENGASLLAIAADLEGYGDEVRSHHDYLENYLESVPTTCPYEFVRGLHRKWIHKRFLSAAVVAIDRKSHHFKAAWAGHPKPVLQLPDGRVELFDAPWFGVVGSHLLATTEPLPKYAFLPGQSLVLVSDGVLNAGFSHGKPFGPQRLLGAVKAAKSPWDIPATICHRVFCHLNGGHAEDDMSIVVLHRNGAAAVCEAAEVRRAA